LCGNRPAIGALPSSVEKSRSSLWERVPARPAVFSVPSGALHRDDRDAEYAHPAYPSAAVPPDYEPAWTCVYQQYQPDAALLAGAPDWSDRLLPALSTVPDLPASGWQRPSSASLRPAGPCHRSPAPTRPDSAAASSRVLSVPGHFQSPQQLDEQLPLLAQDPPSTKSIRLSRPAPDRYPCPDAPAHSPADQALLTSRYASPRPAGRKPTPYFHLSLQNRWSAAVSGPLFHLPTRGRLSEKQSVPAHPDQARGKALPSAPNLRPSAPACTVFTDRSTNVYLTDPAAESLRIHLSPYPAAENYPDQLAQAW